MKALYVDSSVLVSIATKDPQRAEKALKLIQSAERAFSSELAVVEVQSGLEAAMRNTPEHLTDAERRLNHALARLELISVSSLVLGVARSLVKRYRISIGLRAGDAIHIATSNLLQQTLSSESEDQWVQYLTSDRRQHQAFLTEGYLGEYIA